MKQLALGLGLDVALGLDESVAGGNDELVQSLRRVVVGTGEARALYLWGTPGCGRSHWLRACAHDARVAGTPVIWFEGQGTPAPAPGEPPLLLVDDVEQLDDASQGRLFTLYNLVREHAGGIVATGTAPPARLALRPDLKTRLAWGLVYQVRPLADTEKATALIRHAHARGLRLTDEVADYMLAHGRRDLHSLLAALDALDRSSLEQHRPLTVPLLREVLQTPPPARDGRS